eukprot:EG_transcript_16822
MPFILWIVGGFILLLVLMRLFPAMVYDILIVKMTSRWYEAVLLDLGSGSRIVDVGIGTATALITNKKLLVQKDMKVVGVDYDAAYVDKARDNLQQAGLQDRVVVFCKSIYDDLVPALVQRQFAKQNEPFDAVYFSGSFTLMPDPLQALKVAASLVRPGGPIYITQTYQRKSLPGLQVLKPALKYITTIDFGQLTFEEDLQRIIDQSGLKVLKNEPIPGSVDNQWQVARLVVLRAP